MTRAAIGPMLAVMFVASGLPIRSDPECDVLKNDGCIDTNFNSYRHAEMVFYA